jgi:NADPH-dependent ferric siderophore reductase
MKKDSATVTRISDNFTELVFATPHMSTRIVLGEADRLRLIELLRNPKQKATLQ